MLVLRTLAAELGEFEAVLELHCQPMVSRPGHGQGKASGMALGQKHRRISVEDVSCFRDYHSELVVWAQRIIEEQEKHLLDGKLSRT